VKSQPAAGVFRAYIALSLLYIFAPVLSLALLSLQPSGLQSFPLQGATLRWYRQALENGAFLEGIRNSIAVALTAAPISTILGFVSAHLIVRRPPRRALAYSAYVSLPAFVPLALSGLALLLYLQQIHLQGSAAAIIIAHVCYSSPFAFVILNISYRNLDPALEDAARNLGANGRQVLWQIVLPQLRRPLAAVLALTALISWDEFTLSWFVGGFRRTLPTVIWGTLGASFDPSLNALGTMVTLVSIAAVILAGVLLRRAWPVAREER
jgi:spermidine/putrescine transport system permease protein